MTPLLTDSVSLSGSAEDQWRAERRSRGCHRVRPQPHRCRCRQLHPGRAVRPLCNRHQSQHHRVGTDRRQPNYNATTVANLGGSASVTPLGSDSVSLSGSAVEQWRARTSEPRRHRVRLYLTGADAGNYTLVEQSGLSATVTPATITVSGLTAGSQVYNATTVANLGGSASVTPLGSDSVSLSGSAVGTMASKNVGAEAVTVSGLTLTGADAGNYTLVEQSGLSATVTAGQSRVSGLTAGRQTYNATTVANLGGSASVTPLLTDSVSLSGTAAGTMASKNVGTEAVTVSGLSLTGADAGNYTLVEQSGLSANVTKANITVTGLTAGSQTYNATTVANLGGSASVTPLLTDSVSLSGTAAGTMASKNVGSEAVTVSGLSLTGADAGNYTLVEQSGLSATVTAAPLTVTADSQTITQGGAIPTLTYTYNGLVGGDASTTFSGALDHFSSRRRWNRGQCRQWL